MNTIAAGMESICCASTAEKSTDEPLKEDLPGFEKRLAKSDEPGAVFGNNMLRRPYAYLMGGICGRILETI